jgi:hypothetical protein
MPSSVLVLVLLTAGGCNSQAAVGERVGAEQIGPEAKAQLDLSEPAIDFVSMAQGMGVPARRVARAEDFSAALKDGEDPVPGRCRSKSFSWTWLGGAVVKLASSAWPLHGRVTSKVGLSAVKRRASALASERSLP